MPEYIETKCASALHKLKSGKLPFDWDLNIYRGCAHRCKYCYAIYSHAYLGNGDYFGEIYVKSNIAKILERELSRKSWKRQAINIGGVTDSYQPAERKFKLMPDILRLLIKYKTPCIISTKSELILRDYDLIDELSRVTNVNIAATITCMDEDVRKKIEPGGAPSLRRFEVLKALSNTNAVTGLHIMPIVPFLTDSHENINALYQHAAESGVSYVLPGILYLRGKTRAAFLEFIKNEFPGLYRPFLELYKTGGADRQYKNELYKMVDTVKRKYRLTGNYPVFREDAEAEDDGEYTQLTLF